MFDLFNARLNEELPRINHVLTGALQELPEACQPAASHVISAGGKRLRPLLAILFASLFGAHDSSIYKLAISMEMLHAATLLHDDILDQANSRRGRQAAHIVFGIAQTILAGDALLAAGNSIVASFRNPDLVEEYSQATIQTANGEIMEMSSLGNPHATKSGYLEIASGKTACLIAHACALGAIYAGASSLHLQAARDFGMNLGIAFQIVDDALDFAPESQTGKPSGGDLREGKMTLPLQLYRASLEPAEREKFDKSFATGSFTASQAQSLASAISPYGLQSLAFADECLALAAEALAKMPDRQEKQILAEMAEFVRQRNY